MNKFYTNESPPRGTNLLRWLVMCCMLVTGVLTGNAQTVLVDPAGAGGFELGSTFLMNGWTAVNSTTDSWIVGTVNPPGVSNGTRSAYISSTPTGAQTWAYSQLSVIQHLYTDVTIPAGQSIVTLSFKWKAGGEGTTTSDWDNLKVFWGTTALIGVPVANTALSATFQVSGPGATSGMYKLNSAAYNSETFAFSGIPGTTYRLVFSWKSDGSTIANPPAAIDEVGLVSIAPGLFTATALGGLWNSPATWVGGVVPVSGNDILIPTGSTVVVNQAVNYRDITVAGKLQWGSVSNAMTVTRDLLINAGGEFNAFTSGGTGQTVNIAGNFTNNGTANFAYLATSLNFNGTSGTQTLGGSGTFIGDGTKGFIRTLSFSSLAACVVNTTQSLIATAGFNHTGASLNTNGKVEINNTAQVYGQAINQRVYTVVVTGMGSGYLSTNPPTVTFSVPAGTTTNATAVANIDDATGTIRSITITNAGNGYRSTPAITFVGGVGTGATAVAVVMQSIQGFATFLTQKSPAASITGGLTIKSGTMVGSVITTNGGVGYTSAPTVGFAGPTALNLVTAEGSGYTGTTTVTVTGGTLVSGTALASANFIIGVAQGRVVTVYLNTGTTATYSVPPTIGISGTLGSGATLAWPTNCWPTATATISNGMVSNFTMTNEGFGYSAAPTVGLLGGGFSTAATVPTCRVALYNLTLNWFGPSTANIQHSESVVIPSNRKINILAVTSVPGLLLSGDLELYAAAGALTMSGVLNLGGNTLTFSDRGYGGTTGTTSANVTNGAIQLTLPAANTTGRNFPFDATYTFTPGSGSAGTGNTLKFIKVTRLGAPTGGSGVIGQRTYRVQTNATTAAEYGTNPTTTLNYNVNDLLVSDQQSLLISQGTSQAGPWTVRSVATGTGSLGATGSRTTAISTVGPIVPTGDDYFAWSSSFTPPAPLNYAITRNTGIAYNSIMSTGTTLAWVAASTSNDDNTSTAVTIPSSTFTFQGQTVTGFQANTNGWVKLVTASSVATTATTFTNTLGSAAIPLLLAAFYDDLTTNPNSGGVATLDARIRYLIGPGAAGSRKITIEWFNFTVFGAAGPQLNFQIVLDESNNSVTYNYGLFQGFNGTNNHRYSYSTGMVGSFVSTPPQAGEVIAQQYENTTAFSNNFVSTANVGANGLMSLPECNSSLVFVPGTYAGLVIPTASAPVNDNIAGAITLPAELTFPSNLCGRFYTSRNATQSPEAVCSGNADDDVWFKFTAVEPNTTVRLYGSGGYRPVVQILDASFNPMPTPVCSVATANGVQLDVILTGLTVSSTYYVRVYHNGGGVQATGTANISGGAVTSVTMTNVGSGYEATTSGDFRTARVRFTGGNGVDAVGTAVLSGNTISSITMNTNGYGYTVAPTVTIESPAAAHIGEFAIVVYSPAINDDCSGAIALTNLDNVTCVDNQNAILGKNTTGASLSTELACTGNPDDDVWYKFVATKSFSRVTVQGYNFFNPAVEVFNGGAVPNCGTKTTILCSNVTGVAGVEDTLFATTIGNTYFVRVYHAGASHGLGSTYDICVKEANQPLDMQGFDLASPGSAGCYTSTQAITAVIRNRTVATIDFSVNNVDVYVSVTGPNPMTLGPVTLTSGTLAGSTNMNVNFPGTYDMSAIGTYNFRVYTVLAGDNIVSNDTTANISRVVTSTLALPYSQNFNSGTNLTTIGWSATGYAITTGIGVGATNALRHNTWSSSTTSVATAPKVGVATADTRLLFSYQVTNFTGGAATTLATNDSINVEVSSNCGVSYTIVKTINGANHTPSTNFKNEVISLGAYSGSDLIVRFRNNWPGTTNDAYVVIDDVSIENLPACSGTPAPGTATASVALICNATGNSTISLSGHTTGFGISYQWKSASVSGGPYTNIASANNATYIANGISATTYYVCETSCSFSALSNVSSEAAVVVAPFTPVITSSVPSVCNGQSATLTATPSGSGETFSWSPGGSTSDQIVVSPSVTTSYTVTVTASTGCIKSTVKSLIVNPLPTKPIVTPSLAICNGTSTTLTVTNPTVGSAGSAQVGVQTTTSLTGSPYRQGGGNAMRTQYLFTASELTSAGIVGNITSLAFNVTALGSGSMPNYTIKLANTATSALTTTFTVETFTTVFNSPSFAVTSLGFANAHTFSTPFEWDGISNVLVDVCHDVPTGSSTNVGFMPLTNGLNQAVVATGCSTVGGGTLSATRPIVEFGYFSPSATYAWSNGGTGLSINVSPTVTTVYNVVGTFPSSGCVSTVSNDRTVTVNYVPSNPGTIIGNTNVVQGSGQTYSVAPVSGATTYTWTLPATWTGSSTTYVINSTAGVTGGNVEVVANNSCGSSVGSSTLAINMLPLVIAPSEVRSSDCGRTDFSLFPARQLNSFTVLESVLGATDYEAEFSTDPGFATINASRKQGNRTIIFANVAGLTWNTVYYVRARAWVNTIQGPWGTTCQIGFVDNPLISGVPNAFLDPHSCGRKNVTVNSGMLAVYVPGANAYTFNFYDDSLLTNLYSSITYRGRNVRIASLVPGLLTCTTYWVTVQAIIGTVTGSASTACTIETACPPARGNNGELGITAFPNPSKDVFNVVINSTDIEKIQVRVLDALGRVMSTEQVSSNTLIAIGENLPAGYYIVEAVNSNGVRAVTKLVKAN